ncbi:hypothetical protein AVEN_96679-1 [Araneus ventricosus]|uniref:Uncharacterized protein n=1 Tax=Araneus ventricosus TaxID=182803 RepID=A0A4Y2EAR5_ARAVE|nr:hypothetical protein AVEN_96679-1 [Araneus ventricosus]
MRERSPIDYESLKASLSKFEGGILMSEIADSFGEDAPSIKSSLNTSLSGSSPNPTLATKPKRMLTSTLSCVLKSNQATLGMVDQIKPKAISRALHSSPSTRTPSPVIETTILLSEQHTLAPPDNSIPNAETATPIFLPDTSDIDGAITEMSPISMQEIYDEEDLEVLFSKFKGKPDIPPSQHVPSEVSSHLREETSSLHDQVDKIREVLSSPVPNVGQALLLLDQLQADILATEIIQIKPHQEFQQTPNQVQSRNFQDINPLLPLTLRSIRPKSISAGVNLVTSCSTLL